MNTILVHLAWVALLVSLCALNACRTTTNVEQRVTTRAPKDEIVACGQRIAIGTPVVLWNEAPGYDASSTFPHFAAAGDASAPKGLRYQPGRVRTEADGTRSVLVEPQARDLAELRATIDQFVLHYDNCGTSASCFKVLQDQRGLSVHFLLDIDGTLYQTLDLRDQAFHSTKSNPRSIGIEIANIGAFRPGRRSALDEWYAADAGGPWIKIPERLHGGGVRTTGFVGRPARAERIQGTVQDDELEQYDFTPEQYAALEKLAAALCRVFPQIAPDAPRDAQGRVRTNALSDEEWRAFHGIVGHHHVQANKTDPGPAFDWEPFLARVHEQLEAPAPAP